MRGVIGWVCWGLLFGATACDSARRRVDPDLPPDGAMDRQDASQGAGDAAPDARVGVPEPPDAGRAHFDARVADADAALAPLDAAAGRLDVGAARDGALESDGALEADGAGSSDAAPVDGADAAAPGLDLGPPDLFDVGPPPDDLGPPPVDSGPPDAADAGPPGFVEGEALAGAGVRVSVGPVWAETDAQDQFTLGPLPAGRAILVFEAEGYQTLVVPVRVSAGDTVELAEAVRLYRGRQVTEAAVDRLRFRFDDAWLLWQREDTLSATPLPDLAPRPLVETDHEVLIGFVNGAEAVFTRRFTVPGLAGDIDRVALADGEATPLFVEAQPWVLDVGGWLHAMVHTRDALSRLEVTTPGEAPQVLDEGVPWLLVHRLADARVAWAAGEEGDFEVFVGAPGDAGERVSPAEGRASGTLLVTTPGSRGLMWLDAARTLWRWEPDAPARALADDVLPSPRPSFLPDGRLIFFRTHAEAAEAGDLWLLEPGGERRLVTATTASSLRRMGDGFYVTRPGVGLHYGAWDGPGGTVVPGPEVQLLVRGGGALALVGGVAWSHEPGQAAVPLQVDGLSSLRSVLGGALAWRVETGALWYLPSPPDPGPARVAVEGLARSSVVSEAGSRAVFVDTPQGWQRMPLPPGVLGARVDRDLDRLTPLRPGRMLGTDADATLFGVASDTGRTTRWADAVGLTAVSPRARYVAYVSDRGLHVVDLDE
jgi:hypothetical protein